MSDRYAEGLERAAKECDSESEDWRDLESDTRPGEWQREEVAAAQCARLIRALITERRCNLCDSDMGHHELCSKHPLQTSPAPSSGAQVRTEERDAHATGRLPMGGVRGDLGKCKWCDTAALLKASEAALRSSESFWVEMLDREECGCFQRDCRVHGAYSVEDVERVKKAREAHAKKPGGP